MIQPPAHLRASNLSALPGIAHGFFGRDGGVSSGIYASLNCGLGSNDRRAKVLENRGRVAKALGGRQVVTLYQAHTPTALVIDEPVAPNEVPKADAVVTATPGLVVGALAADCTPVLMADAQAKVVAAVHAGWRGAVAGVLEAAIGAMQAIGADKRRIRAAIGPCISQAAYEVGPEFEAELLKLDPGNARFFALPPGKTRVHFDLPAYVTARLVNAGVADVELQSPCTTQGESYFSYRRSQQRREPDYGRQISAIVVT